MDALRLIQPPQSIEPKRGGVRPSGRGGVGSAFAEVLARAVGRSEPVHVGAMARDRLDRAGISWTPELQAQLGEVMGRFVQRGNQRGLALRGDQAFVLSVPDRELVDVVSQAELGTGVVDEIDAFAFTANAQEGGR